MHASLGERVYVWRRRRRWNQQELADTAHVHRVQISKIERDRAPHVEAETVKRLALALGVTTDYLLGLTNDDAAEATYARPRTDAAPIETTAGANGQR